MISHKYSRLNNEWNNIQQNTNRKTVPYRTEPFIVKLYLREINNICNFAAIKINQPLITSNYTRKQSYKNRDEIYKDTYNNV